MNLQDTWKNCLDMWKWIAEECLRKYPHRPNVSKLKRQWMKDHGFEGIASNCFFCAYDRDNNHEGYGCKICPGVLVDPDFRCCEFEYAYDVHPFAFFEKLVELNRLRNRRNRGKKRR